MGEGTRRIGRLCPCAWDHECKLELRAYLFSCSLCIVCVCVCVCAQVQQVYLCWAIGACTVLLIRYAYGYSQGMIMLVWQDYIDDVWRVRGPEIKREWRPSTYLPLFSLIRFTLTRRSCGFQGFASDCSRTRGSAFGAEPHCSSCCTFPQERRLLSQQNLSPRSSLFLPIWLIPPAPPCMEAYDPVMWRACVRPVQG